MKFSEFVTCKKNTFLKPFCLAMNCDRISVFLLKVSPRNWQRSVLAGLPNSTDSLDRRQFWAGFRSGHIRLQNAQLLIPPNTMCLT